jgi:hypothetical protein
VLYLLYNLKQTNKMENLTQNQLSIEVFTNLYNQIDQLFEYHYESNEDDKVCEKILSLHYDAKDIKMFYVGNEVEGSLELSKILVKIFKMLAK